MREVLLRKYGERRHFLEDLRTALQSETEEALSGLVHVDRVYFRVKSPESFMTKALDPRNKPPYRDPLVEIEDQVAGRVLVYFLADVKEVRQRLEGSFTTVESIYRRPEKDEAFGYESHHLICIIPPQAKSSRWEDRADLPKTFELQLRTLFMHAWAEPQHDLEYKGSEDLPRETRKELYWVAASAWGADQAFDRVWNWQLQKKSIGQEKK